MVKHIFYTNSNEKKALVQYVLSLKTQYLTNEAFLALTSDHFMVKSTLS